MVYFRYNSNPLIEVMSGDTFNRTSSVLSFLQYHLTATGEMDVMGKSASFGLYLILDTVKDAIEKQAVAIKETEVAQREMAKKQADQ